MLSLSRRSPLVLLFVLLCLVVWGLTLYARDVNYAELSESSQRQLQAYQSSLQNTLERYDFIPELLATNPLLVEFMQNKNDLVLAQALNLFLNKMNNISETSVIYLLDPLGTTLASSNWSLKSSFVGKNYAYRGYFSQAMKGLRGQYYALGSASQQRGYYYSYPLMHDREILGVVVIKLRIDQLEASWRKNSLQSNAVVLVSDPQGVTFLSSEPRWLYRSLQPLTPETLQAIRRERRYGDREISALPITLKDANSALPLVSLGEASIRKTYLHSQIEVAGSELKIHLFSSTRQTENQVLTMALVASSMSALLLILVLFIRQRISNVHKLRQAHASLELRVAQRTQDLTQSNAQLSAEVDERHRAERRLLDAQDNLVQTAKLAMLGQMSAGINHELNQPLAGIRAYAENARKYLSRGHTQATADNLGHIVDLCVHMGKIIAQFKIFARKSNAPQTSLSVQASLQAALNILAQPIKQQGIDLQIHSSAPVYYVLGDMVRLEQVLVNLLNNAIQAVTDKVEQGPSPREKKVSVELVRVDDQLRILVRDSGPGIDSELCESIFEPFMTTKTVQQGLGLGLSISRQIIEHMQGRLWARNHPEGGAEFIIELPLLDKPHELLSQGKA